LIGSNRDANASRRGYCQRSVTICSARALISRPQEWHFRRISPEPKKGFPNFPSEKSRKADVVRLQFGHSTPKYQLPAVGVIGASLNKPCQDIGRPPPCAATLTIDSKASTFFSPCVDIVEFPCVWRVPEVWRRTGPLEPSA